MATKTRLQKVLDLTGQFVIAQKGVWDHDEWEAFLGKAAALGIAMDDESKRCLGNILESSKGLYSDAEDGPAPKKPAAKPRARKKG